MSMEQKQDLPLDEIASDIAFNIDNIDDKESIDLFSEQKENSGGSDINSDAASILSDDDDEIDLMDDDFDFDEDSAINDLGDDVDHGNDMPCVGFTTVIKRRTDNPDINCDYYVYPPDYMIEEHPQVMNGVSASKTLRSKPDVIKFLENTSKLGINLDDDCIEKLNAIDFKGIIANLTPVEKKILDYVNANKQGVMYQQDEDDDDDYDEDYEEHMKKLESNFDNSILLDYHPELKQANYNEILAMCKIIRNSKNEIVDPLHKTISWLTKFEISRILGLRSKQINNGADTFVDVPPEIISGYTIAEMELEQKKIPFILRRPLPNGGSEYWRVSDLDLIDV